MRRAAIIVALVALAAVVVGVSIVVGFVGEQQTTVFVFTPNAQPYLLGGGFDWELFALTLAGGGTLALALVTGVVAATTWQDVRASQRVAEASVEANRLVRDEQERRPQLTLAWDPEKGESIPAQSRIRVRLRVHNGSGLRPAQGTRVLLDKCVTPDGTTMVFGSPALRWMGERTDRHYEPVVVFGGAWRVITLGDLVNANPWRLKVGVEHPENFGTGTTYRLVVGSDEADARFYDVIVGFQEDDRLSVKEVFNSLVVRIDEAHPEELSS
jgi:hypothetical protein